jgi:sulfate-transporting ATPase
VTHDRYFLDNVAGWILELDRGSGIPFEGNYSEWLTAKSKRLALEEKQQSNLNKTIAAELEFINQKAKGQQKKGQARMRRYDDLVAQASAYVKTASLDSICIPTGPRLGDVVVEAQGLRKAYGDRLLFEDLNFSIPPGSIVGIIGGNGAGKSTLFRMIMGKESPDGGVLRIGETVVPMYVDQSRESLDGSKTVFQEITEGQEEIDLNGRKINARSYCNQFNFGGEAQQKKGKLMTWPVNLPLIPMTHLSLSQLRCFLEESATAFISPRP